MGIFGAIALPVNLAVALVVQPPGRSMQMSAPSGCSPATMQSATPPVAVAAALAAAAGVNLVAIIGILDDALINLVAVFTVPLTALASQSVIAIRLVRAGYLRRSWRERY